MRSFVVGKVAPPGLATQSSERAAVDRSAASSSAAFADEEEEPSEGAFSPLDWVRSMKEKHNKSNKNNNNKKRKVTRCGSEK